MDTLMQYVQPTSLTVCLCVGYVLKNTKPFESFANDYIPLVNFALGIVLVGVGTLLSGDVFSVDVLAQGGLTGLASVGLHQMFSRTIEGLSNTGE